MEVEEQAPAAMTSRQHVWVSCFDMPLRLVEVELAVLEPFTPRLWHAIKYDPPEVNETGQKFWRTGMTLYVFAAFIMSLRFRKLCVGKNVAVGTLLNALEYEGVVLAPPQDAPAPFERLPPPQAGVAYTKKDETARQTMSLLAEQMATAIVTWPRLEDLLRSAPAGGVPGRRGASLTRCWLALEHTPVVERAPAGLDKILFTCEKNPRWLRQLIFHVGVTRAQMIRRGVLPDEYKLSAYKILTRAISSAPLVSLWFLANDVPSHARTTEQNSDQHSGHAFAGIVRTTVLGAAREEDHEKVHFARALVAFASDIAEKAPCYATLFSGDCCDDSGGSTERQLFMESLRQRKVTVVKYAGTGKPGGGQLLPEGVRPLGFPGLSQSESKTVVLLDFSNIL